MVVSIPNCLVLLVFACCLVLTAGSDTTAPEFFITFRVTPDELANIDTAPSLERYIRSHGYKARLPYAKLAYRIRQLEEYFAPNVTSSREIPGSVDYVPSDNSPIKTHTKSTTVKGGPSYTNMTSSVERYLISVVSYSSGNAASAGGGVQMATTASNTASSGKANSTATVTAKEGIDYILVNSTVVGAVDRQTLNGGPTDAFSGTSCSAEATGASAYAFLWTTIAYPVDRAGNVTINGLSGAFCEAGTQALSDGPEQAGGTSSSGSKANLSGVLATVNCDGAISTSHDRSVIYKLKIEGRSNAQWNFTGTFTGERIVHSSLSCK